MTKINFSPAVVIGLGAVIVPATAHAQDAAPADRGFYGSLSAGGQETKSTDFAVFGPEGSIFEEDGYGFPGDTGFDIPDLPGDLDLTAAAAEPPAGSDSIRGKLGTKTGFAIAGAVGYDFGVIRTELEASWLQAKISGVTVTGVTDDGEDFDGDVAAVCADPETAGPDCEVIADFVGAASRGKLRQLSGMANAWLDIPIGFHGVEPYVGGGIGFTHIKVSNFGHDTVFAWQVGGGVAIPLADRLKLTIDYRHRQTKRPDFGASSTEGVLIDKLKTDAVLFGVRAYF